jgi:hypothetical protein
MSLSLFFGALFVAIGLIVLKTGTNPELKYDINVISNYVVVEEAFEPLKAIIGDDFSGYKGHIYRVLTYTQHFLKGDETYLPLVAEALVYHDVGLWTDKTLAYLEPSEERATIALKGKYSQEEMQLIHDIIHWHHKITPFTGAHAAVVDAVRRADWIDASQGFIHQGMPKEHISKVFAAIPEAGFYKTLQDFGPRLHGSDVWRIVKDMVTILKW